MDAVEAWRRLALNVRASRRQAMMSQAQLGAASGTSESTVRHLEGEVRQTFSPETLAAISQALGWTPDSAERILDGLEPVEAERSVPRFPEPAHVTQYRVNDLEVRVSDLERELARMMAELERQRNGNILSPAERADALERAERGIKQHEAKRQRQLEQARREREEREARDPNV